MTGELLSRDTLAKRQGGIWDYISPSRLNTWLACPLKFKLKYIDGIETPTSPNLFLGKAVHRGLEDFYRHRQLGVTLAIGDLTQRLLDDWTEAVETDNVLFASSAEERTYQDQALRLVDAYLRHVGTNEPRPLAVEVAAEAPLIDPANGEDIGIPLVGVMDLILPDSDGATIVDFKTTGRSSQPLAVMHEVQLGCYSYLFRYVSASQEGGLEIRNLVKSRLSSVQFHRYRPRTDKHVGRLFAVIRAYLDDLDSGRFLFRPGLGCLACEFRKGCIESE
jgi:putative RecB family exonuclease